ncbi:MAG: response regulator [Nitrospinae bacterium]|nr:response regulator [Nitrospinota bacterium]
MNKAKLLIVEDSKIMAKRLHDALSKCESFEIVMAQNGLEALEKLKGEFFPILVTDLIMPVMDGFQLIEEVKNSRDVKREENIDHIIIVVSSMEHKEDIHRAIALGAYDFISKPMDIDLFLAKMKNYHRLYTLMLESEERYQKIKNLNSEIMDGYENRLLESQALTEAIEEQKNIYRKQVEIINDIQKMSESLGKKGETIIEQCRRFLELDNLGKGNS